MEEARRTPTNRPRASRISRTRSRNASAPAGHAASIATPRRRSAGASKRRSARPSARPPASSTVPAACRRGSCASGGCATRARARRARRASRTSRGAPSARSSARRACAGRRSSSSPSARLAQPRHDRARRVEALARVVGEREVARAVQLAPAVPVDDDRAHGRAARLGDVEVDASRARPTRGQLEFSVRGGVDRARHCCRQAVARRAWPGASTWARAASHGAKPSLSQMS